MTVPSGREMPKDALAFFQLLFRHAELVLFRLIDNEGAVCATHHLTLEKTSAYWNRLMTGSKLSEAGIFFGVNPRTEAGKDHATDIRTCRILWADLDHCSPSEALERVQSASGRAESSTGLARPSIGINSGNGVHLYWLLTEPVEASVVKPYVQGIAKHLRGDSVSDVCRVLRVPGSLNRKSNPPRACSIFGLDASRVYPLAAFDAFRQPAPVKGTIKTKGTIPRNSLTGEQREDIAKRVYRCKIAPVGRRSGKNWALVSTAIKFGMNADALYELVKDVGKFAERDYNWFIDNWDKAYSQITGGRL